MKQFIIVLTAVLASSSTLAQNGKSFTSWREACNAAKGILQEGDLIFLDIPIRVFREVARTSQSWTSHVGIAFKGDDGNWVVAESTFPISRKGPLCNYLKRSSKYRFEIRRLKQGLSSNEVNYLRSSAEQLLYRLYHLGFDFDSQFLFCSKYVYLVYESIGVAVGEIQTFQELLQKNPEASIGFWKWWFLNRIPWDRRTITPASQIKDTQFRTVLRGR